MSTRYDVQLLAILLGISTSFCMPDDVSLN
jgi:hypothetical protein